MRIIGRVYTADVPMGPYCSTAGKTCDRLEYDEKARPYCGLFYGEPLNGSNISKCRLCRKTIETYKFNYLIVYADPGNVLISYCQGTELQFGTEDEANELLAFVKRISNKDWFVLKVGDTK